MAKAEIMRDADGLFYGIRFACPGCTGDSGFQRSHLLHVTPIGEPESPHVIGAPHWEFDRSYDAPTFNPSVLAWHPLHDDPDDDDKVTGRYVCHSFVRNGRIQYLDDCTHAMRGQTVDLPDIEVSHGE